MTKKPDKKWLAFASNLYLQSENYQEAESFLNLLLTLYPSSQLHWKQLSSVQFKNDKRKETLASFRLAEKVQPLSKETAVIQLISLLVDRGIPYKAGQILKKALKEERVQANQKNYEILGDCWMQAEEVDKAVEAYEQSSKKNGDNGNIFVKLGRIYLSQNHWSQAVENMEKGLNLGEVDRIDEVYMQMGISYYNLKKYNEAIHSFQKAEELEGDYEISSRQWIRQAQNFL